MRDRRTQPFRRVQLLTAAAGLTAAAALTAAATIAACGSNSPTASRAPTGSDPSTGSGPSSTSSKLAFSKCIRANGVPNFPDPKVISSSDGNQTVYLPGINPYAPAFQRAAKACGGFNPKEP